MTNTQPDSAESSISWAKAASEVEKQLIVFFLQSDLAP